MTITDLFPGNIGRMKLTRVILKLRKPELREFGPGDALPADLTALLQKTIKELESA